MVEDVRVGDRVRTYDFDCRDLAGADACYTEGIVVGFLDDGNIYRGRYIIQVELDMWAGKKMNNVRVGHKVFPPVNGRIIYPANIFMNRVTVLKPR